MDRLYLLSRYYQGTEGEPEARAFYSKLREGKARFPFACPYQVGLVHCAVEEHWCVGVLVMRGTSGDDSVEQTEKLHVWFDSCDADHAGTDRRGERVSAPSVEGTLRDRYGAHYTCIESFGSLNAAEPKPELDVQALVEALGAPWVMRVAPALSDPRPNVRADAAASMEARLTGALGSEDRAVREAAVKVLDKLLWQPGANESGAAYWAAKGNWDECARIGVAAVTPLIDRLASGSAAALVQIGAPAVEPLIVRLEARLYSYSVSVRQAAAMALGQIGDPRAFEPLEAALKDADKTVRQSAAQALGVLGDARAVEPLVARLEDKDSDVRRVTVEALARLGWQPDQTEAGAEYWVAQADWAKCVQIGAPAVGPLIAALKDKDGREPAADSLVQIGVPAVAPLIAFLKESGLSETAAAAAGVLGRIGPPAVEPLISVLGDESVGMRREAVARALGQTGDARAVEPLIAALGDYWVRGAAADALEHLGWQPDSTEKGAAYWVAKGEWDRCAEIGAPAVGPLVDEFLKEHSSGREAAARTLGRLGDARAVEPLIAALGDVRMREVAVDALESLGWQPDLTEKGAAYWAARGEWERCANVGPPAVGVLSLALKDSKADVRLAAVKALTHIGAPSFEPLLAAISESGWPVRKEAAEGLVHIYKSGKLDQSQKARLLTQRDAITRPHADHEENRSSDCGTDHTDQGIGVPFSSGWLPWGSPKR